LNLNRLSLPRRIRAELRKLAAGHTVMCAKDVIIGLVAVVIVALPLSLDAAVAADPPKVEMNQKSVNPPNMDAPVKPGTVDKPPQPVAPGTIDAPPKPAAPGTLDRNVINPDLEIRKGEKPVPK
jgi:hypothetical protein